ncbi:hypothetical protein [Shinella zoogloeoides]|uniref:hypothetical protein n=1 Tax=Shinella zoogloeoides TaxID=352475 RepID=UPI0028B1D096|nr:hypothetical protein [Shinella zoogloeoides]
MPTILVRKVNIETGTIKEVEEFVPDHDPLVVLADISKRQFYQQLAVANYITESEAVAAVATGAFPAAIEAIVVGLPSDDQFPARMFLMGATTFERTHPLVGVFAAALGMSESAVDAFWIAATEL